MAIQVDGWSVVAQYRRCGKPTCTTCREGHGHGPYYYGTRVIDGRHYSKYFGRTLPDIQDNAQDSVRELELELARARETIDQLRAEIDELRAQNESLQRSSQMPPASALPPRELSQQDVQRLWDTQHATYPEDIQRQAYDSIMQGLFPGGIEHTRLHTGGGRRPYVCPFRGPRFRYATPDALVRSAIPWVLNRVHRAAHNKATLHSIHAAERENHKRHFAKETTQQLTILRDKMQADLEDGNLMDWTVDRPTLMMYQDIIKEIVDERGGA